ncbi:unnamed protein product [Chrysoparadoxa australica]
MSASPTPNPLKHVLNAIGEDVDWISYTDWGCFYPEGEFILPLGPEPFAELLKRYGTPTAQEQWDRLMDYLLSLSECTMGLPPFGLRTDVGAVVTLARYARVLLKTLPVGQQLQGPFGDVMDACEVTDPFIRNHLNLLCFLLQGLPADGTLVAVMAYMCSDFYREGAVLDYPKGGTGALVDALVRGVEKREGSKVVLNAHVEEITLDDKGRAGGVRLRDGKVIKARRGVISNASQWDTLKLLPDGALPEEFVEERQGTPQCKSFMHVHLGVKAANLPKKVAPIECHYTQVLDWEQPIDAAGNVIVVSIPSVLDPSLAPPGCHVVHAYTAGNEPYNIWEGLDTKSQEYKELKDKRAKVLMDAVEKVFPGLDERLEVKLIGTPLTHERFLRRDRGTYGPEIAAGQGTFAGPNTPLKRLMLTGDSGEPAVLWFCCSAVVPFVGLDGEEAPAGHTDTTLSAFSSHPLCSFSWDSLAWDWGPGGSCFWHTSW